MNAYVLRKDRRFAADAGNQIHTPSFATIFGPAIIASVATSLYNIVDSIFIGQGVGPMAIAGLAITFPLMNLVVAFVTLIAVGGATISSIFLGQKNISRATDVINNVFMLCLIHSVVFGGITLLFLDDILYFFGATPETIVYAREFMRVILLGTPISFVFIGLNNLMRATGYPKKAMISALLSVLVNVILAPIFIFVMDWGIAGAATATMCGQFVAFLWVLWHFMSRSSFVHLKLKNRWFTPSIIKRIYSIGLSPFLMNVCACIVVVFINKALLDHGGADGNMAIGAYGIINRSTMFFVMIVFGVTQGMQPILGYNFGANHWERVKLHIVYRYQDRHSYHYCRLFDNRTASRPSEQNVYNRRNADRHSTYRIPCVFHMLSCRWLSDCHSKLFSIHRQTAIVDIPQPDTATAVSYPIPADTATDMARHRCMGEHGSKRYACLHNIGNYSNRDDTPLQQALRQYRTCGTAGFRQLINQS